MPTRSTSRSTASRMASTPASWSSTTAPIRTWSRCSRSSAFATAETDMSFSVRLPRRRRRRARMGRHQSRIPYSRSASTCCGPRFLRMLRDILRFNRLATALARSAPRACRRVALGAFLDAHRFYGAQFRDWYLLPMVGCIWSLPDRPDAGLPAGDARALLPQPRPAAGRRPAAVAHRDGRLARLRREDPRRRFRRARLETPVLSVRAPRATALARRADRTPQRGTERSTTW